MNSHDRIERLLEIKEELADLVQEAETLLRGTEEHARARAYWLAHIRCALDDDHSYLGGSVSTMQDSIDTLMGEEPEEEEA